MSNRIAYDLGVALGLAAIALVQHRRRWASLALAALASLASPVAGAFLVLAAGAWVAGSTRLRRPGGPGGLMADRSVVVGALFLAGGAALPIAALVLPFPEGGQEPFAATSFWPALAGIAMVALILPRQQRVLRVGTVLYGLACGATFAFPDPLGGNAVRLGTLFAGPLVAGALWPHRVRVLAAAAVPLVYWQCVAPVRDVLQHIGDPAVRSAYFRPLVAFLGSRHDGPFRVEIPFTLSHWEAYSVARVTPIARGWERQVDILNNGLFYRPGLTASSYRAWLQRLGVRYVALPDAPLDDSGRAEAALIRQGLPYLTPVWSSEHWRVYRVQGAVPLAAGPGHLRELSVDSVVLHARRPGNFVVRENFTPYWTVTQGYGCVAPGPGGLTQVSAQAPGTLVLGVRFSLARIGASTPRCSPPPPPSTTARR